jgi:hypothetical protein
MRYIFRVLLSVSLPAFAAEDVATILSKARDEFIRNEDQARYWVWNTTAKRYVTDKRGGTLETLPAVQIESPIRPDGRRCNAVVAWSDGLTPYLLDAPPEERCQVEQEARQPFNVPTLLASRLARIKSRRASSITIEIRPDKSLVNSVDGEVRCAASIQATIEIDTQTYFPKVIAGHVVEKGCDRDNFPVVEHYGSDAPSRAASTFRKGATFRWEYELERDRIGAGGNDFWIRARNHSSQPLRDGARVLFYWGRRIELASTASGRMAVADLETKATRVGAQSDLKFEGEVKK